MNYFIEGHNFKDDVLSIIQLFFANQNFKFLNEISKTDFSIFNKILQDYVVTTIFEAQKPISIYKEHIYSFDKKELRRVVKLSVYNAIKKVKPIQMPWGILTGIRPAKKITEMKQQGLDEIYIKNFLKQKFLVDEQKIDLAIEVSNIEEKIIKNNNKNTISLYFGIPFCPTRCIYCSFPSYSISQYIKKVDDYLNALEKEIKFVSQNIKNFDIESIYIGGGTPTSLNEIQLDKFLSLILKYFKKPNIEYTLEAGRADTINNQKLKIIKNYPISRISINPQTMNDKTLELIGRGHNSYEFKKAFFNAREHGFNNINTDIILGLTNETPKHIYHTMKEIFKLNPESLTVHTLCIKRASRLKENIDKFELNSFNQMEEMLDISKKYAKLMDMHPYYMYRQKNMVGNLENVGYCKPNFECFYNVQIMEEKQTIIALGSGASSKFFDYEKNRVERVFNVKSVDDYICRIDEMIKRKEIFLKLF